MYDFCVPCMLFVVFVVCGWLVGGVYGAIYACTRALYVSMYRFMYNVYVYVSFIRIVCSALLARSFVLFVFCLNSCVFRFLTWVVVPD